MMVKEKGLFEEFLLSIAPEQQEFIKKLNSELIR